MDTKLSCVSLGRCNGSPIQLMSIDGMTVSLSGGGFDWIPGEQGTHASEAGLTHA